MAIADLVLRDNGCTSAARELLLKISGLSSLINVETIPVDPRTLLRTGKDGAGNTVESFAFPGESQELQFKPSLHGTGSGKFYIPDGSFLKPKLFQHHEFPKK